MQIAVDWSLCPAHSRTNAFRKTAAALESATDLYFETRRPVPELLRAVRGDAVVKLAASVLIYNELRRQGVRPAELARQRASRAKR